MLINMTTSVRFFPHAHNVEHDQTFFKFHKLIVAVVNFYTPVSKTLTYLGTPHDGRCSEHFPLSK